MKVIFMNKKLFYGLIALILAIAPMQLSAQQSSADNVGAYGGFGYLHVDVDDFNEDGIVLTADADGFELLIGYRFSDNLSAEIAYEDADYTLKGNYNYEIDEGEYININVGGDGTSNEIAARVLVHGNLDGFRPFIGITYGYVEYTYDTFLEYEGLVVRVPLGDEDDSGTGYIIGADMVASDDLSVRLSFSSCSDCDDYLFIGPIYKF